MKLCVNCNSHTVSSPGQTGLTPGDFVDRVKHWYIIPDTIDQAVITSEKLYVIEDIDVVGGFTTFKQQPFNYYYDAGALKYLQPNSRNNDGNTLSLVGDSRLTQNDSVPYALDRANQVDLFDNL
jgi:hypothetical protein